MDIQSWLDQTVLPEQLPSPDEKRNAATNLQAKNHDQTLGRRRERKPSTSDSSLLEAQPQHRRTLLVAPQVALEKSAEASARSDESRSSTGSESSASSQPYARRPRRKTRLERYEPASKHVVERGTHTRRHRKGESSRQRRRKRKKVDNLGIGFVQGFQAKNISQDRLTVRATTIRQDFWVETDDWCSSSREKNWDCSARAGCQRLSRAVAVSTLCSAPAHGALV